MVVKVSLDLKYVGSGVYGVSRGLRVPVSPSCVRWRGILPLSRPVRPCGTVWSASVLQLLFWVAGLGKVALAVGVAEMLTKAAGSFRPARPGPSTRQSDSLALRTCRPQQTTLQRPGSGF